ncbi:nicotinate (nicotinamide) nucleotide adenylyltransferase [Penaeicola halotolerans]|uniref:nicotinate (nicotinamide) nucleotide adenylyltransferase n=1 Tax=Penaeicola halotolerans TaxID=2793196 RepID=UPI001CF86CCC|nr:nicotinate (nicotinamide) nucleotide adenylyltransferase [Penaeicola halotolerans]
MKVGLFFGSFNPIHIGHLAIAEAMISLSDLDEIWFVVSPQNPFKSSKSLLHEFDRLKMVELAIEDNFHFKATDVEFHMPKPSYTVDTLAYLVDKHPQHHFSLIMGSDNLSHFHKWKNHEQILAQHELYIYPRPENKDHQFENHPQIHWVEAPMMDISATYIRQMIQSQKSVKYLLQESVIAYIEDKKLYW